MVSIKSGGAAASRIGQYKKRGRCRSGNLVSIKNWGAAATRNGQYKKRGRCRSEKWSVSKVGALPQREMGSKKAGALPQGDPGSKKLMALLVSIKSGGAAAARNGEYKKRGRCCIENWAV